jgi:hypothetical protein
MKKIFTTSFLAAILFIAFNANAQLFTITETHQLPAIGDSIHYVDANNFGFDPTGVGTVTAKIWDFSALMVTGTSMDFTFVDPSTISPSLGRDSFPTATIARHESGVNGYFYYKNTANNINRIGAYANAANFMIYKDATVAKDFHFPITAGQNYNSTYYGNYSPFGVGEDSVRVTDGTLTGSADMQGKMILPTGTFDTVLRIHIVESFHIKTYMMGMVVQDDVISDDYYYWFVDTIRLPLFISGTTTVDGTPQTPVLRYQPILGPVGISNIENESLIVYPNPTSGIIYLNTSLSNDHLNLEVYDMVGKLVNKQMVTGSDKKIDLTALPKGVYSIKIYNDTYFSTGKIVLK